MRKRLQLKFYGRVQGVFFRAFVMDKATELGLTGYVQNMPDSTVEAVCEGEETKLRQLVAKCRKGPHASQVTDVDEDWTSYKGEFLSFSIRR
jgi:acylphosphatase